MATIRQYDPRTDTTYVYESKKYYDREQHKSKTKRRLIGKIDKATGEIVPTGPRGRPRIRPEPVQESGAASDFTDYKSLYESYAKDSRIKASQIQDLKSQLEDEKGARREFESTLRKVQSLINACFQETN